MSIRSERVVHRDGSVTWRKVCTTRREAIKVFCAECHALLDRRDKMKAIQLEVIRGCTDTDCPLFPFRVGKNPFTRRKGTFKRSSAT